MHPVKRRFEMNPIGENRGLLSDDTSPPKRIVQASA
jgi:hypothetical protein